MSRVTILMVVLDGERYLEDTLSSISCQTHDDIEVVMVDGGSSDDTVGVFERYKFRSGIVKKIIRNDSEVNIVQSFNMGANKATGKYIYQLCSDDLLLDVDWLSLSSRTLDMNDDIGAVWGRTLVMRDAKEVIRLYPPVIFQKIPQKKDFIKC